MARRPERNHEAYNESGLLNETCLKVSGVSHEKRNRGGHLAVWTQKIFSPACKAQGNQHKIRIMFFEHD